MSAQVGSSPEGFADFLLSGRPRRDLLHRRVPVSSIALRRFLPGLTRVLARVDADAVDRDDRVPPRVIAGLKRAGAFRLRVPEVYGGLGFSLLDYHRVVAVVAARSVSLATWLTAHQSLGVPGVLNSSGTLEQRKMFLPPLASGRLSAFAVTESEAGSDPSRIAATARPLHGRAAYRLDGRKIWVTNGPVADWVAVLARAPGGITAFLVSTRGTAASIESRCRFMGLRGVENGVLRLRGAIVPASCRVGAEGEGLRIALNAMNLGRLGIVARCLGAARECLRISREWTSRRRQHGRPIDHIPAVAESLERMAALTSAIEAVLEQVSLWGDEGLPLRYESALAKVFATEAAWEIADTTLQLRGGRGYETADSQRARGEKPLPVERIFRDLRALRIVEGNNDVLLSTIAERARFLTASTRAYGLSEARGFCRTFAASCLRERPDGRRFFTVL